MSDRVVIGKNVASLESSPAFDNISKVSIVTSSSTVSAGDTSGYTLTVNSLYGTTAIATALLNYLSGYSYQPMNVTGAVCDPAIEVGDGVSVGSVYSGAYKLDLTFGHIVSANISAEADEEVDHEYPSYASDKSKYVTKQQLATAGGGGGGGGSGVVVNGLNIASGTVTQTAYAAGSIVGSALANLAVSTAKLASGAVTNVKIGGAAVTTGKCDDTINDYFATVYTLSKVVAGTVQANTLWSNYMKCNRFYIGGGYRTLGLDTNNHYVTWS